MTQDTGQRRHAARRSRVAWYATIPVALVLSIGAAIEAFAAGTPWAAALLVFVTILSVWTGVESVQARLNADLPIEEER